MLQLNKHVSSMNMFKIIPPLFWYGLKKDITRILEQELSQDPHRKTSLSFNLRKQQKNPADMSDTIVSLVQTTLREHSFLLPYRKFYFTKDQFRNDVPLVVGKVIENYFREVCVSEVHPASIDRWRDIVRSAVLGSIQRFVSD